MIRGSLIPDPVILFFQKKQRLGYQNEEDQWVMLLQFCVLSFVSIICCFPENIVLLYVGLTHRGNFLHFWLVLNVDLTNLLRFVGNVAL